MRVLVSNKKISLNYDIIERYEAGIVLTGAEVKSLKSGNGNINDAYVVIRDGEAFVINMHIPKYKFATSYYLEPDRTRKLLLHKNEIRKLLGKVKQKGFAIIPVKVYLKNNIIKMEIALCKGKKKYDKRETIKKREFERQKQRMLKYKIR